MRKLFIAVLVAVVLSTALGAVLLLSSTGLTTAVRLVTTLSGGLLTVGESHGRLAGGWRLNNVMLALPDSRVAIEELACRWHPRELLHGRLSIADLTARRVTVTVDSQGQQQRGTTDGSGVLDLPSLSLPFAVLISSVEIDRLEVQDTTGGTLFSLIHLRAGVSLDQDQLTFAELRVQTPTVQADLAGSIRMSGDWPLSLSGNWSVVKPGCSPVQGTAAIDGSAAAAAFSLSVVEPLRAEMAGTFTSLPARLSWELKASGRQLDPAIICADWPVATADLVLAAAGTTSEYHGTLEITAELAELPSFSAALPFAGTVSELTLEQGRISGAGGSGQLSGRLSWQEGVSWQAELDLTGLDPGNFQSSLAGALDLTVSTKGGFSGAGLSWQADLKRLHYQTTVLAEPLAGTAQLVGTAQGVSGDVQLSIARSALAAQAEIDWTEGVTWDGRLALEAFDPSVIEDLPSGAIDAVILSHGHRGEQQIEVAATLERLSGRLAGYDLQGGGAASYRDGRLLVNDLQVSNGGNRIVLNGAIDELIDLQFSVDGTDLERLYAPLRGDLNLVGRLSGTRSAPILDGRFETTTLFYHDYGLESGSGTIRFGHDGPETIDVTVQVHGLTGSGVSVQQGSLVIAGSRADHRVVLDLRGAIGQLTATLAGTLTEDWQWAGMLREAGVVSSDHGSWRQQGTADLLLAAEQAKIAGFCVDSAASSLCGAAAWQHSADWSIELSSVRLALGDLQGWGVSGLPLAGTIAGDLAVSGAGPQLLQAEGTFTAADLSVNLDRKGWYPDLRWSDSRLDITLENSTLTTSLHSRFSDDSNVSVWLEVADLTGLTADYRHLPLSGRVQAEGVDPGPLAPLTDDYLLPSGRLTADLTIAGELAAPLLTGSVDLAGGEIGFPELGIALADLHGTVQGLGDRLTVELQGTCGSGTAHGTGELSFPANSWRGVFTIDGDNCLVVNQSELMIVASPAVELTIGPDGGTLSGVVQVPEASVQPEEMRGSVSPSSDVVFVEQGEEQSTWPFVFTVDVDLGSKIQVEGYGVAAALTGRLTVSDTLERGLTGTGELTIKNGTFALYGQPLHISRGRVLFTGGMIDNPDLDIVAEKKVQGSSFGQDGAVVGVKVTGSAQDYHLELFSQPTMAENDIVAYLLLDKPIASGDDSSRGIVNEAIKAVGLAAGDNILGDITGFLPFDDLHLEGSADRGGASLVLGKRLTDDLSISYDFNLFEHAGAFRVRYEFGYGFFVQSKNSIESNGVELLYSFER